MGVAKIGFTVGAIFGAFDFVHAGHCALFEECKKHCDYLIIGLHRDPTLDKIPLKDFSKRKKRKPIMSLEERYRMLRGNKWVDAILVYDTEKDLMALEKWLPVDFRFSGIENKGKSHYKTRGRFVYITGDNNIHSTNIRNKCVRSSRGQKDL